jgi:putative endonuclease
MSHFVYIARCNDGTLYTGYAVDVERRIKEHNGEGESKTAKSLGASYTRSRRPVRLMYFETFDDRAEAQSREYAIKQLSRDQKQALINTAKKRKK